MATEMLLQRVGRGLALQVIKLKTVRSGTKKKLQIILNSSQMRTIFVCALFALQFSQLSFKIFAYHILWFLHNLTWVRSFAHSYEFTILFYYITNLCFWKGARNPHFCSCGIQCPDQEVPNLPMEPRPAQREAFYAGVLSWSDQVR